MVETTPCDVTSKDGGFSGSDTTREAGDFTRLAITCDWAGCLVTVACRARLTVLAILTAVPELTLPFACLFVALPMGAALEMACLEDD